MTNPHQTNSVEEVVEEIIERYNIDPEMAFGRPWLTQQLTTLVEQAREAEAKRIVTEFEARWRTHKSQNYLIWLEEIAARTISSDSKNV